MPGPLLVLASAALVAAAVAGAWYALGLRPSATRIVDVLALDGEYAVMIRDVARDPGRSFLSLIGAERGEVWGAMIPGYEPRDDLGPGLGPDLGPGLGQEPSPGARSHLAATAGVISVRGQTGGVPYIQVFAAARGAKLGRYALAAEQPVPAVMPARPAASPGASMPGVSSMAGGGQSFEVVADARGAAHVVAIDLEKGAPLWRRALGAGPIGPLWLRERHLLVHAAGRLHVFDRRTGEPMQGRQTGEPAHAGGVALSRPCALSDRVYGIDAGAVHALSLASGERRPTGIEAARLAGLCGTHGDRDILAVIQGDTAALVAVDARTLAVHWRLDLGQPLLVSDALYLGAPDALAGPLPRFVPVLAGQAEPALAVIDVETGHIARAGTPTPLLRDARILHAGDRFYLWTPAGPTLAVLDGATGALAAAVELPDMAPLWPRHMAGGRIWVTRLTHDRDRRAHAWFVLDDKTLAVEAAGLGSEPRAPDAAGAGVTEVRARFAGSLGLP